MPNEFDNSWNKARETGQSGSNLHTQLTRAEQNLTTPNSSRRIPDAFPSDENFVFVSDVKEKSEGEKRTKDPKLQTIFNDLAADSFDTRQTGSQNLSKFLTDKLTKGERSEALRDVFRASANDPDPEVKRRTNDSLSSIWKGAKIGDRATFLGHQDQVARDWAFDQMRQIETMPMLKDLVALGGIADKSPNQHLARAIGRLADENRERVRTDLFQDEGVRVFRDRFDFAKKDDLDLGSMSPADRQKATKALLKQTADFVQDADKLGASDLGGLARVLMSAKDSKLDPLFMSRVARAPGDHRMEAASTLAAIATSLKESGKDQKTVDELQKAATQYLKESLITTPDVRHKGFYSGVFRSLRNLNPAEFDRLVPDRLSPQS